MNNGLEQEFWKLSDLIDTQENVLSHEQKLFDDHGFDESVFRTKAQLELADTFSRLSDNNIALRINEYKQANESEKMNIANALFPAFTRFILTRLGTHYHALRKHGDEVVLRAYEAFYISLDTYDVKFSFRKWLGKNIDWKIKRFLKKKKKKNKNKLILDRNVYDFDAFEGVHEDILETIAGDNLYDDIISIIDTCCNKKQRDILMRYYFSSHSFEDISSYYGVTSESIRKINSKLTHIEGEIASNLRDLGWGLNYKEGEKIYGKTNDTNNVFHSFKNNTQSESPGEKIDEIYRNHDFYDRLSVYFESIDELIKYLYQYSPYKEKFTTYASLSSSIFNYFFYGEEENFYKHIIEGSLLVLDNKLTKQQLITASKGMKVKKNSILKETTRNKNQEYLEEKSEIKYFGKLLNKERKEKEKEWERNQKEDELKLEREINFLEKLVTKDKKFKEYNEAMAIKKRINKLRKNYERKKMNLVMSSISMSREKKLKNKTKSSREIEGYQDFFGLDLFF